MLNGEVAKPDLDVQVGLGYFDQTLDRSDGEDVTFTTDVVS